MSRWTDQYEAHAFHAEWDNLTNKIDELNNIENVDIAALAEIARLSKLTDYISNYLKVIDPEVLNNLNNIFNTMLNEARQIVSQVSSYMANKNIAHLHQANNHIETCLNNVKQFHIVLPKITGQSISSMLKKYNKTIEDALSHIKLTEVIEASNQIEALKKKLLDGEDSVAHYIEQMTGDAEEKHAKLLEYYNHTLNDAEFDNTTKDQIEKSKEKVEEARTEIEKHLKETKDELLELSKKIEEYEKYYVNVFGELNESNTRVGGIKDEINKRINALDEFEVKQQKNHKKIIDDRVSSINTYEKEQHALHKKLFEKIEKLLPSATSAGLAKAYHDERVKFEKPIKNWNRLFLVALLSISFVSIATLHDLKTFEDLGKGIMHTLPISGPLIWLAIYASKRRSESQRLEQEYAHKEALANSYSSYKQQIEGLNQEDQELLVKLIETAIEAVAYNASTTLDGKHGDNTPIEEILTKANRYKTQFSNLKD